MLITVSFPKLDKDFDGTSDDAKLALSFARNMGVVSVLLNQVPNGHCTFAEDVKRNNQTRLRVKTANIECFEVSAVNLLVNI